MTDYKLTEHEYAIAKALIQSGCHKSAARLLNMTAKQVTYATRAIKKKTGTTHTICALVLIDRAERAVD